MTILRWVCSILFTLCFIAVLSKGEYESYTDSFKSVVGTILGISLLMSIVVFAVFLVVNLMTITFGEPDTTLKPTVLLCNENIVVESVNGFIYNSNSGTYEDVRSRLTYTPKQGEVCREYLKGDVE